MYLQNKRVKNKNYDLCSSNDVDNPVFDHVYGV